MLRWSATDGFWKQAPLKDYRGYFFNGHPRIVA
jgi:hypothetical protein